MAFGEGKSGANPGPTTQHLVGQGRVPCRECGTESAGGQGRPPLRKRYRGCNGRATARVAPTEGCEECVGWVSALAEVF